MSPSPPKLLQPNGSTAHDFAIMQGPVKTGNFLLQRLTEVYVPNKVMHRLLQIAVNGLVSKYVDHLPLYRQEVIFGRAGLAITRSTLAAWVGSCGVRLQPLVDALKAEVS